MSLHCLFSFSGEVLAVSLTLRSHYVAFIHRKVPENSSVAWVLFNDEKVVKAIDAEEMKKFAYVYFFERL